MTGDTAVGLRCETEAGVRLGVLLNADTATDTHADTNWDTEPAAVSTIWWVPGSRVVGWQQTGWHRSLQDDRGVWCVDVRDVSEADQQAPDTSRPPTPTPK